MDNSLGGTLLADVVDLLQTTLLEHERCMAMDLGIIPDNRPVQDDAEKDDNISKWLGQDFGKRGKKKGKQNTSKACTSTWVDGVGNVIDYTKLIDKAKPKNPSKEAVRQFVVQFMMKSVLT